MLIISILMPYFAKFVQNQALDNLSRVMETDFLNFHDEEHFGTALYQNELLDDSQSSILDIVGDDYHQHNYEDHSIIWEQDVERELNGDLAVIPMSGQINTFPKLSNSPPSKDFQKIFCDWQHLTSIEATPSDDLTVDLQLSNQGLVVDMLDCLTPPTLPFTPKSKPSIVSPTIPPIVSSFDFSNTEIPQVKNEPKTVKKETKPIRKTGGKNLELLKKVIKQEKDTETPFKTAIPTFDEFDVTNDNFDITSYVNGGDDLSMKAKNNLQINSSVVTPKKEKVSKKRSVGCYEKSIPVEKKAEITKRPIKQEPNETSEEDEENEMIEVRIEIKKEEKEDELIDVETVTEQIPVLEARDLNSLLEQFEATEAVNPSLPPNVFEEKPYCQPTEPKITTSVKTIETKKIKPSNHEIKQPIKSNEVTIDIINKIKANTTKKPISLIPARPTKKIRPKKIVKSASPLIENNSFQLDHDYCSISPSKSDTNLRKTKSPDCKKCDTNSDNDETVKCKKVVSNLIDDTAIRIGKQIKNAINNENALKQTVNKTDGKVMISLLKNNRNSNAAKQTIINTINTNSEQIKNIIVNETIEHNSKKRKLNLEEYKKLRGEILKTSTENSCQNSPGNSGTNSPLPVSKNKIEYQELIMKMASEILKTNVKPKQNTPETKLEKFVPPEIKKKVKPEVKDVNVTPKKNNHYQIKTIVSIGVNTDNSYIKDKNEMKTIGKFKKDCEKSPKKDTNEVKHKLNEIITPILQNASNKINSNSLITNITETLLHKSPKISPKNSPKDSPNLQIKPELPVLKTKQPEHGEDKTVIILNKNEQKPEMVSIAIQTEIEEKVRNYRKRRDSSASSSASGCSGNVISGIRKTSAPSLLNSSSISISSSLESRWSRSKSRSRSRSRSASHSEYSSYSSDSSRSKSRSVSPRRWNSNRDSRSRNRYIRSRRRSRSRSDSYRGNYRHSRSPYSRSRSRRRRERENADRERMKEVEERRVIYVGKINDDTTRTDLRRRFQSFGPITNVSVHFRDHGDNYGFVTFAYKMDAYEAVERGNDDPNLPKYDISFGGRRAFCKTRYSDLDNIRDEALNSGSNFRQEDDSFDMLLREVQAKLLKRKV